MAIAMQKDDIEKDLKALVEAGNTLGISLQTSRKPPETQLSNKRFFKNNYDLWYTTSLAVISQVIPDRKKDFVKLYEKPSKERKTIDRTNFVIQDYLDGYHHHFRHEDSYSDDALTKFKQQFEILKTAHNSFDNALFRIESLCRADLLNGEIAVAEELCKNKYLRASGAVARVILEKHLQRICKDKNITPEEKKPTLGAWIACLQKHNIIDDIQRTSLANWSEITNYCCHQKEREPTKEEVGKLINGVKSFMKKTF